MQPMLIEMDNIIEGIIQLHEHLLSVVFEDLKSAPFVVLNEIPISERDPTCPIRIRIGLSNAVQHPT